jgi:transposase
MRENELPNDVYRLKQLVLEQQKVILDHEKNHAVKDQKILNLKDIINLLQRRKFASQSEVESSEQLGLFNEIEDLIHTPLEEAEEEEESNQSDSNDDSADKPKKKRRPRLPASLPREEVVIDLDEKDKVCAHDGHRLEKIGEEVSEKLEIIPAKVFVKKTIRFKYACPCCDEGMKTARAPLSLIPKSMASASLVAFIIISKFMDGLPLYRQEAIFKRIGMILSRGTMARWLIEVSKQLMPVYNLLQEKLLARDYVLMDETPVQVLKEEGKKATSKSYMWVRYSGIGPPIVLYDYSPTRSGQVPLELLEGFSGYLQVDAYAGYSEVCTKNKLIRLGCMDHARRKFMDAFKTSGSREIGKRALVYFKLLYKIEEDIKDRTPEEKKKIRQDKSKSILVEMKDWVDSKRAKVPPQSVGGKAMSYFINEYDSLIRYLEDGRFNISNAPVENKIRPFAIGRKNWLFSQSVEGAQASAMFYSLVETAKANNVEPFDWLRGVLEKLPHAQTVEDYEALLPFSKKMISES